MLEGESSDVIVGRVKIELVDTSMLLIKLYGWLPFIVIAGVAIALVAATVWLIRRLRRKVEKPLSQFEFR
jgi:high-affinity Fe2+/Pb2+ permease